MATVIRDFKDLPKVDAPVPAKKPAVTSFPYHEMEHADEADDFIAFIREMRRNSPALTHPAR